MSRDSNQNDPRFKIANREALIGVGLVLINFGWWYGFAYGLGSGSVEEYTYVFGFPAWFFYSCIVGFVVMVVLVTIVVKYFFTYVPFEVNQSENESEGGRE
ncbi:YhdT family protein [Salipaludibacillus agaradhaerens]|uniref:YhdT family protein n=1 Tax=Salipaludibacillus agaradhaerens TaxID=76935 RepID=UPI00215191D6|nr:YhdT family protein [Salipaludibacillus agaradhaerens]MCR6108090.1 YhdT family protein [Salipaludibacillus agaradhaerens]MCR6120115.1 YhdT family protein [Salipaludibacillus agaradhaerens]UJW59159.1 YhdT family protein [Bacillus sp. A116_S68]